VHHLTLQCQTVRVHPVYVIEEEQVLSEEEALALCIQVMKNVTYCFNSVTAASWDINCKHPSCKELLLNTIDKVEGR